ncbi:MAG: 2-oxoacid:acceptor oxidoreductase family protein [Deltaproteobacteria bacterium]|nr:2-oxoacid:acceptor oxidoreductase family protein [Deltaproteobacteria bacterium]
MDLQMVIVGLGGEGIVFITRILAEGFYRSGHPVISMETHGMAMRGGSVISQIKVGNYQSPMIRYGDADMLLGTSEVEAQRNLRFLKEGGIVITNANGEGEHCVDATGIAHRLGNPRGGNVVLLGFALARLGPTIPMKPFLDAIRDLSPHKFLSANVKAFKAGWGESSRAARVTC